MQAEKGNPGMNRLANVLAGRMREQAAVISHPIVDYGEIQADGSLLTDDYPIPIPHGDYLVCRGLTLGKAGAALCTITPEGGTHTHDGGAHGGHEGGDGSHTHEGGKHGHTVPVPEKLRGLSSGDRVLVVWRGSDAVVVDIILPAAGGGG